jgi:isopentenyl-diphosphate Delta-isomerase
MKNPELVVLVDEEDREIGVMEKEKVHHKNTPLHRAFSVFLFNGQGELLVTQRAKTKKTWGGVWSNSFCGHPAPGETRERAIMRRGKEELGVEIHDLRRVANYRYRFERKGVVENEICPVYIGTVGVQHLEPNKNEVEDWKWMSWRKFKQAISTDKPGAEGIWSEWCKEEAELIIKTKLVCIGSQKH